jgi:hypothetical protein
MQSVPVAHVKSSKSEVQADRVVINVAEWRCCKIVFYDNPIFYGSLFFLDSPYMVKPWKGITPLGGKTTEFSNAGLRPFSKPDTGQLELLLNIFSTSVSLEKHSII